MDEASALYRATHRSKGPYLTLRWKGKVRYTVPRQVKAQAACWSVFRPGLLGVPLRAMAQFPRIFGSIDCTEGPQFQSIRDALGCQAGLSSCRGGSEGVWSKNTVLFLDGKKVEPLCIVKVGMSKVVDSLLQNEAQWLRRLHARADLVRHLPELIAHHSGANLSFLAQSVLFGEKNFVMGRLHVDFLQKLHRASRQVVPFQECGFYRTLVARLADLNGHLSEEWSARIDKGMKRIESALVGTSVEVVAAHGDFTAWNIGLRKELACVFDWEFAADEQLPLFDPLHFALMPVGFWNRPTIKIVAKMRNTIQQCKNWFDRDICRHAEVQALAYFINLCTLYLWSKQSLEHPLLVSYGRLIDCLCKDQGAQPKLNI